MHAPCQINELLSLMSCRICILVTRQRVNILSVQKCHPLQQPSSILVALMKQTFYFIAIYLACLCKKSTKLPQNVHFLLTAVQGVKLSFGDREQQLSLVTEWPGLQALALAKGHPLLGLQFFRSPPSSSLLSDVQKWCTVLSRSFIIREARMPQPFPPPSLTICQLRHHKATILHSLCRWKENRKGLESYSLSNQMTYTSHSSNYKYAPQVLRR